MRFFIRVSIVLLTASAVLTLLHLGGFMPLTIEITGSIERRTLQLPRGTVIGSVECTDLGRDCCEGGGSGDGGSGGSGIDSSSNTSCLGAATYDFGATYSRTYTPEVEYGYWWVRELTPGTYKAVVTGMAGGSTLYVYSGICGSLTVIDFTSTDGCIEFTLTETTMTHIYLAGVEFVGGTATVTISEGACP